MDLAVMRDLPNMTVIAPSDSAQCIKAIRATLEYPGPVCFRIARGAEPAVYTTQDYDYEVGKAITALDGTDLTIIATGSLVALSISAANGLAKEGISGPRDRYAHDQAARQGRHRQGRQRKPATSSRRRITSSPVVSAVPLQRR